VSVRSYTHYAAAGARRRDPSGVARAVPWVLTAATVLAQIAYPLLDSDGRDVLTVVTVVLFFLASTSHAFVWRGAAWTAAYVVITLGVGLAVEAVGHSTNYPFGSYDYTDELSAKVLGVPWVIPLAWSMMTYPALVAAQRLCRRAWTTPLVGALALASWDVFLDPQQVDAGYWVWEFPTPSPPLVDGIPWTNFAGWFLVALVLMLLLDRLPRHAADDAAPATLYLWTYGSSVLANAVFFDRPEVAVAGGIVMGLVAIPYAWVLWSERA
jgi:putative membrane protein